MTSIETSGSESSGSAPRAFATTSWSMVNRAATDSPDTQTALSVLCKSYWYPLYAFLRRKGHSRNDADDLTQAFFAELLEKRKLAAADESRGKFRTFLLTALDNFIKNRWRADQAAKRGGKENGLSIDFAGADQRYLNEPFHELTAEKIFERSWALTILNQTLTCVREQYEQTNKTHLFEALKIYLGEGAAVPYREVAESLGMKEGAVKVAVHRLRERYGEQLRLQIAHTIDDSRDVDQELHALFDALR
jgi:RNA polymerase sigma-70 factor (ECF subfamily)